MAAHPRHQRDRKLAAATAQSSPAASARQTDARRRVIAAGTLLFAMTVAAYAPVWQAGFIWDDDNYVVENAALRSTSGLLRIWLDTSTERQYYPLAHTSFWIEYHLWGLDPAGYHLTNVALHAASAILLWRLLVRLRVPGAWGAAALFAVHPVMVESVAWISERKNTLSLLLALGALYSYMRFSPADAAAPARPARCRADWAWYATALMLFAGALASKTVVASLPAVVLVIYGAQRGRIGLRDVVPLVPFIALGAALGLLTARLEQINVGAAGEEWNFTLVERLLIAGRAAWFYAAKLAWPYPLAFFYPRFGVDARAAWQYLFPLTAAALPVGLWLARHKIGRGPLAVTLIFGGVLSPALGFFDVYPFRYSLVADHFQYHAAVVIFIAAAAGAALAAARLPIARRMPAHSAGVALLVALALVTNARTGVYKDLETLYRDTIAKNPSSPTAYENLAVYFNSQGRYEEARALFVKALALHPSEMAESNLGHVLLRLGERGGFRSGALDEAAEHFRRALVLDPESFAAGRGLALALLYAQRYDEAFAQFARTLKQHPANAQAHVELGDLLAKQRRFAEAAEQFRQAVRLMPANLDAWNSLGILAGELGDFDESIACFEEMLRQQPDAKNAQGNLETVRRLKITRDARR